MVQWLVEYMTYAAAATMFLCIGGVTAIAMRAATDAARWRHEAFRLQRNAAVGDNTKTQVWAYAKPEVIQWYP